MKIYLSIIIFVLFIGFASSLGITPAIKNIDFVPNQEYKITFYVLDAVEGSTYDVSLGGGTLAEYASISAGSVNGAASFILTIKFPEKIEKPGQHTISVSVKERPSEESFINTLIEVGAVIKTFVPYPGIYGDMVLNIPDGNINEKIPVELQVINRGDNILDIEKVYIDFISDNGSIATTLDFTPVSIPVSNERYFRKYLDTSLINPGNYIGSAKVRYANTINEINKSFRIGSLFVNITNFTNYLIGGGIQKFYVNLESKWNSRIEGVYLDINISKEGYSNVFRTPSVDLNPWDKKIVESYLDTEGLEGLYKLTLMASYHEQSTTVYGNLFIGKDYSLIIYVTSAIIAILFFILFYYILGKFFRRKKK